MIYLKYLDFPYYNPYHDKLNKLLTKTHQWDHNEEKNIIIKAINITSAQAIKK